ncbi:hypothetical protein A3SI_14544 [Nitritalea halalkaliphila LW7]|uniref:Bacteroidetes-specific membrane protein n=1 Tax=Nitritalea halalkaliphila LW7 TaxID=1189621 RepID=I5BZQ8_9BACT|nr:type IX secretion system membrane protein PorP/SprF [Nitritalea halalkaliphila]EIM75060.1 hypothetical protein A3SI_14544 [Nitritalea halalkaliphila LW7]
MFKQPSFYTFFLAWLALFGCVIQEGFSQQDPQFTQYMFNKTFYNPAFAGQESGYVFSALHRSQWFNYTGTGNAPTTQLITANGRLDKYNLGFGLNIVNDDIGPTINQELNLSVAYHRRIRRGVLSMGLSGGAFASTIRFGELDPVNPDLVLPDAGRETQINFNIGAGIVYDTRDYYVGISSRHVNQPAFNFGDGAENPLRNHSYLTAGYRIRSLAMWEFEPSFLIKTVGFNNFSYDVSVIATHNRTISGGLAFRGQEGVSVLLGYSLLPNNALRVGYAFDLVFGGLEAKAPTSHEFMVTYNLPQARREVQRVIQRTPRFRY